MASNYLLVASVFPFHLQSYDEIKKRMARTETSQKLVALSQPTKSDVQLEVLIRHARVKLRAFLFLLSLTVDHWNQLTLFDITFWNQLKILERLEDIDIGLVRELTGLSLNTTRK